MADFHINKVPTFSLLQHESSRAMEAKVLKACTRVPVGVLIPALYSDLSSEAMNNIIQVLTQINFVRKVYISLDRANYDDYKNAQEIIAPLGDKAALVWNDKPEVVDVIDR